MSSHSGSKSTLLRLLTNGRERIRYDGNEHIQKPKVDDNDAKNEEQTRDKEFGVHHLVHDGGPRVNARYDGYLQGCEDNIVEAF